VYRKS